MKALTSLKQGRNPEKKGDGVVKKGGARATPGKRKLKSSLARRRMELYR